MNLSTFILLGTVKTLYQAITAYGLVFLLEPKRVSRFKTWACITIMSGVLLFAFLPADNTILTAMTLLGIDLFSALFFFRGSVFQRLFVLCLLVMLETFVNILLWGYFASVGQESLSIAHVSYWVVMNAITGYWMKLGMYFCIATLSILLFRRHPLQITDRTETSVYSYATLQTIILSIVLLVMAEQTEEFTPGMAGAFLTASIGSAILLTLLLQLVRYEASAEAQMDLTEYQLSMQRIAFAVLQEEAFRIRSARHDLRNNVMAIEGMLATKEYDAAIAFIDEIQPAPPRYQHANSLLIESILTSRARRLERDGVSLQCSGIVSTDPLDVVSYCDAAAFLVDLSILSNPDPNFPVLLHTSTDGGSRCIEVSFVLMPPFPRLDFLDVAFVGMEEKYAQLDISMVFTKQLVGDVLQIRAICMPAPKV